MNVNLSNSSVNIYFKTNCNKLFRLLILYYKNNAVLRITNEIQMSNPQEMIVSFLSASINNPYLLISVIHENPIPIAIIL